MQNKTALVMDSITLLLTDETACHHRHVPRYNTFKTVFPQLLHNPTDFTMLHPSPHVGACPTLFLEENPINTDCHNCICRKHDDVRDSPRVPVFDSRSVPYMSPKWPRRTKDRTYSDERWTASAPDRSGERSRTQIPGDGRRRTP